VMLVSAPTVQGEWSGPRPLCDARTESARLAWSSVLSLAMGASLELAQFVARTVTTQALVRFRTGLRMIHVAVFKNQYGRATHG